MLRRLAALRPAALAALAAVLLVAASTGGWAVQRYAGDRHPTDRNGWRLAWADEFDGPGLDRGRWTVEDRSTFGDGNGELACLMSRPDNVAVRDGVLSLIARREPAPLRCGGSDARFPRGRAYSAAMISTKGLGSWTYGRFEIRARTPTAPGVSRGLWPAFWMRPVDGGKGELDILEAIGSDVSGGEDALLHHTLWYDYSRRVPRQTKTARLPAGVPSDGMHVYAVEWRPRQIRWFVDGALTYVRDTNTTPWLTEAFSRPFFLRLNLAVGGSWPGAPTASTRFPAAFEVDYVRIYQPSSAQGTRRR